MRGLARFLIVIGLVVLTASKVGAQGFSSYGGGNSAEAPATSSGQFAPTQAMSEGTRATGSFGSAGLPSGAGYEIGPTDVLDISVFGVPELSGTVIVADNGTVQLPLLGETPAAGKSARQLQSELAARLGADYLQNPQVTVVVREFNSRIVTLTGEINRPGVYPLKGETTLLQLVASAGGFSEGSDSTVLVLRKSGGKRRAARFDISAIEKGRARDPVMRAGDTVVAGSSTIKKVYKSFLKALPIAGAFAIF